MNINLPSDHDDPKDCQLIVCLTGEKSAMKEKLQSILREFDSTYGKPCQGTGLYYKLVSTVITPVWDGTQY